MTEKIETCFRKMFADAVADLEDAGYAINSPDGSSRFPDSASLDSTRDRMLQEIIGKASTLGLGDTAPTIATVCPEYTGLHLKAVLVNVLGLTQAVPFNPDTPGMLLHPAQCKSQLEIIDAMERGEFK
jgi:hypothetical protein